jgi:hypothetical protein
MPHLRCPPVSGPAWLGLHLLALGPPLLVPPPSAEAPDDPRPPLTTVLVANFNWVSYTL